MDGPTLTNAPKNGRIMNECKWRENADCATEKEEKRVGIEKQAWRAQTAHQRKKRKDIPSMALYIAEIVTIVRHKKFHNSFYALFVMRAIPDWLGVLDSFYSQRLPSIIGSLLYPIYSKFPNWMIAMALFLAGHTFQANNLVTIFILLNRLTAIIMPIKHEKMWRKLLPLLTIVVLCVPILTCWPAFKANGIIQLNDPNSTTDRNFIMAEAGDIQIISNMDPKTIAMMIVDYPLIMDIGTVVLSSCLLLWASGTFRQQLIKDLAIIRFTDRAHIRYPCRRSLRKVAHDAPVHRRKVAELSGLLASEGQRQLSEHERLAKDYEAQVFELQAPFDEQNRTPFTKVFVNPTTEAAGIRITVHKSLFI
ncbi:hypothetical protein GPALN_014144 [Globodera pallida]|nr:hypothetical protein GPALN_014144 [Globodera pallida]